MKRYVTKTGKVLTDEDIEALADEAEAGYDIRPCGGMADTVDSKSIASRRVGSTPTKVTMKHDDIVFIDGNMLHHPFNAYKVGDTLTLMIDEEPDGPSWEATITDIRMSEHSKEPCVLIYYKIVEPL